jgi:hypothetical protein
MSFSKITPDDLVISSDSITAPIWTGGNPVQTVFYTSSADESATLGNFYTNVYQTGSSLSGSEVQFAIGYGHILGSGSTYYNSLVPGNSPTRTIYGQYRTLIYGDENTPFNFGSPVTASQDMFVIAVERSRYKESLFPGSFTLKLSGSAGNTVQLIDDSSTTSVISYCDAGRIYKLISGSAGLPNTTLNANGYTGNSGSYGLLLPDVGLIILNPRALSCPKVSGGLDLSLGTSANTNGNNTKKLFSAISGSSYFALNSSETLSSDYVFVRVRNSEFNYTTNPSMISGSGELVYSNLINNPRTYITTIGLYNDNNDLLAVAKVSKPLQKDFTKEALLRIKIDF